MKNLHIEIKGKVQGVGFRYSARLIAQSLGIKGYVKNLPDKTVFIEAEGTESSLNEFVKWCKHGPERAIIEEANISEGEIKNFSSFETRY